MPDQAIYATAFNRPQPREGPDVPYNNDAGSNPVLRGLTLAVVSRMYGEDFVHLRQSLTFHKHRLILPHPEHFLETEQIRQTQGSSNSRQI